jgi:hypothetical protein
MTILLIVLAVVVALVALLIGFCVLCLAARIDDCEEHAGHARRS